MSLRKVVTYLLKNPDSRVIGGFYLTISNILVCSFFILLVYTLGEKSAEVDTLDLFFEFSSVLIALIMFAAISGIKININIKGPFLLGLFCMQLGRTVDGLDEIIYFTLPHWSALGDGIAFFGEVLVVYGATRWMLHAYRLSMTDNLTRLYNRHYLELAFQKANMFRRKGDNSGIHLIMLDIDDFKRINDCFGHETGDDVLRRLAVILQENTRPTDIVARQGGEEFEILVTDSSRETALTVAERIRKAVEHSTHPNQPQCTASLGVSEFGAGDDIKSLRRRADLAVYEAKATGKNRVVFCDDQHDTQNMVARLLLKKPAATL